MKKMTVIGVALGTLVAVGAIGGVAIGPFSEHYVAPLVKEKLNDTIRGSATYDSLRVGWNGTVVITNLHVEDSQHRTVIEAPKMDVSLSPWGALKASLFQGSALEALGTVTLEKPQIHLYENPNGAWNVSNLVIDKHPEEPFAYRGNVEVQGGEAAIRLQSGQVYHLTDLDGTLRFGKYPVASGAVKAKFEGQSLAVSGDFDMKGDAFKARIQSDRFAIATLQSFLPPGGTELKGGALVDTDVTVERKKGGILLGGQSRLEGIAINQGTTQMRDGAGLLQFDKDWIHIRQLEGTVNGQKLSGEGTVRYKAGVVELKESTVHLGDGDIQGQGWFNSHESSYDLVLSAKNADVGVLGPILGQNIGGHITGQAEVQGAKGQLLSGRGQLEGDISYEGYTLDHFKGAFYSQDGTWYVPYVNGTLNGGDFTASGHLRDRQVLLHVAADQLPLALLAAQGHTTGSGTVHLVGTVQGDMDNPEADFSFASGGGSIHGFVFDHAVGKAHMKDHTLTLTDTLVNGGKGTFTVDGAVGLEGDRAMNLRARLQHMRAETLLAAVASIPVTGWVDGDVTVLGTLGAPKATGTVRLYDGSVAGQLVSDALAHITYEGDTLTVPDFSVKAYGSTIRGQGRLVGKALDFTMTGEQLNLRYVMKDNPYHLDGFVNFTGHVGGTVDAPVFEGHVQSPSFTANGIQLAHISGNIYYDPTIVNFREFQFDQGKGHVVLSGGMRFADETLFGSLKVQNGEVGKLLKTFDAPVHNLDGDLTATILLGGTLKKPDVGVTGTMANTSIGGHVYGTSDVDMHLENRTLTVKRLRMPIGQGFLAMAGTARLNGDAQLQMAASDVPIRDLVALSGKDLPLTGLLQGVVNVTGKTKAPTVEASATVKNFTYNGSRLDLVYALATLKDGVISISQVLAKRDAYQASLYGKVPLKAFYSDGENPAADESVDLRLNLNHADLGALPLFVPIIEKGEGPTEGSLHITGPMSDIAIDGALKVKNGRIFLKDVKQPLDAVNGAVVFAGKKAALNLATTMGEGKATLDGSASWGHNRLTTYGAQLILDGLDMASPYFRGKMKGHFELLPGDALPTLHGYMNLDDTTIDVPLNLTTSKSALDANLDVTVEAPNGFRFYNSVLYDMMLTGKVHAGGTLSHPQMDGAVTVKQGTVKYLNNRFKVEEGRAKFDRLDTFLPTLDMRATADVSTYRVKLNLKGPIEQMKLGLTSDPPLSQQQLLSLMTVHTLDVNDGNLGKNALNTIVSTGLQMVVFGAVENAVKDQLHLDRFTITNSYLDPFHLREAKLEPGTGTDNPLNFYTLEVGKYVYKDFMITAGTGLNYSLSRLGLEYRINKYFDLNAWKATNSNYFIGANFKYRF